MSDRLPLTEVGGDEIIARTVYQIILCDYKTNPEQYDQPAMRLFDLAFQWREYGCELLHQEIELVAVWCAQGGTVRAWLSTRVAIQTGRPTRLARLHRAGRR